MKAVVSGGAGFIGSHIVTELVRRGYEVAVIDNSVTGKKENLAHVQDQISFFDADINDEHVLAQAMQGATYVFHVAAIPGVPVSIKDPVGTHHANVEGTEAVLRAAKVAGVKRVIFSSSAAVYGDTTVIPTPETTPAAPISPYAEQKIASERLMERFNREGLETVCLRYFNVFGERQDPSGSYAAVIPLFISLMKAGQAPHINGDGTTTRDFTYVANVVDANIRAALTPEARGEIFNIACGKQQSLNDLVAAINAALGTHLTPTCGPFREGDIKESFADISKARKVLGYEPVVSFEEGIRRTMTGI